MKYEPIGDLSAQLSSGGTTPREEPGWSATVEPEVYRRDSDFIAYTVQTRLSRVDAVFVGPLYHSPDRLKLFAVAVMRDKVRPEERAVTGREFKYGGNTYVGFRERLGEPWQVFPFGNVIPSNYSEPDEISRNLTRAYFRDFKGVEDRVDDGRGGFVVRRYEANLGERAFWSSLVWQKNVRAPGLYIFQTRDLVVGGHRYVLKDFPLIAYPADLLAQFESETLD